jgi:hypothetical protein
MQAKMTLSKCSSARRDSREQFTTSRIAAASDASTANSASSRWLCCTLRTASWMAGSWAATCVSGRCCSHWSPDADATQNCSNSDYDAVRPCRRSRPAFKDGCRGAAARRAAAGRS